MGTGSKQNVCAASNYTRAIMIKIVIMFFYLFITSCHPVEKIVTVVFDNDQLPKFEILSKKIEIKNIFEKKISEPYIGIL